jgi:hypothetical protein
VWNAARRVSDVKGDGPVFEDQYPFKDGHAKAHDAISRQIEVTGFEGLNAEYRLGFQSMKVPGFPDEMRFERVRILQAQGPVYTQWTDVVQQPTPLVAFEKWMYIGKEVADNLPLSVVLISTTLSASPANDMAALRDEATSCMAIACACYDERLAQREVFEDMILLDEAGSPGATLDMRARLRHFRPFPYTEAEDSVIDALRAFGVGSDAVASTAARWYLKAAQSGPTTDAVVFLWVALEGLVEAEGKDVPRAVQDAAESHGFDTRQLDPSLRRLYGLRADIVHNGQSDPPHLKEGFYILEGITRLLLRRRLEVQGNWPIFPDTNPLAPGIAAGKATDEEKELYELLENSRAHPEVVIHEV